ncbi:MAG TPA: L-threonylcarbamoyladenylate synthase [Symbiobacteriaceae bacterium]|nr:L-threonylcarbamoyladenylate synthase [Symbiobacteriaceae bacterium]
MDVREMHTEVVLVSPEAPSEEAIAPAAAALKAGHLVAFPTETVYGLGANALDGAAVAQIFAAKGRPADNPLIVHVADRSALGQVVREIPPKAIALMDGFWPGPLTLVLPRQEAIPTEVSAGLATVGVRMPSHPIALALIRAAGVPIAAPSANRSGRPSPTSAEHVLEDMVGRIPWVLDGGETGVGLESTVLDLTVDPPVLLRPGGVTVEQLQQVIGEVQIDPGVNGVVHTSRPRSPGMKYTHYAPKAPVILVEGPVLRMQAKIVDLTAEYQVEGKRVGILCATESMGRYGAPVVLDYGGRHQLDMVAANLFRALRAFDRHRVDVVLAEAVPETGIGLAVMNRLRRAAGGKVVSV